MRCAESLRVQAYFDAEVDAVSAAGLERHIEHCAECRALLRDLEQLRAVLRRDSAYAQAPPGLRANIMRALDQEGAATAPNAAPFPANGAPRPAIAAPFTRPRPRRPRPFWMGALGGIGGTAIAATCAFLLLVPRFTDPLLDDLVNAHVRSLMPAHLIDVVSTDKHTVKPWFAGHADVSPAVADFDQQGYKLVGGRADYFDGQRAAVVVYQHGAHVVNVFTWAAAEGSLPKNTTRNGYHLAFWRSGNLVYCAVSDAAWDELLGLAKLLQDLGARDNRE